MSRVEEKEIRGLSPRFLDQLVEPAGDEFGAAEAWHELDWGWESVSPRSRSLGAGRQPLNLSTAILASSTIHSNSGSGSVKAPRNAV